MGSDILPKAVKYENGQLIFLDQTKLPLELIYEKQETLEQVYDSIKTLKVRGAPAIGIAGAFGLLISMKNHINNSVDEFIKMLKSNGEYLIFYQWIYQ